MRESRVCILCLIGLPAAGKTSLASLISEVKLGFSVVLHVCYDDLITWDPNNIVWKDGRTNVLNYVGQKIQTFLEKEPEHHNLMVILDDNMYYRSMRYAFYKLARKLRTKFCQLFLDIPLNICLERNFHRNTPVSTYHMLNINDKIERPSPKNDWERDSLIIDDIHIKDELVKLIQNLIILAHVPDEIEQEYDYDQSVSKNHIADIALRKIVSLLVNEMRGSKINNIPQKVSDINRRRKELLDCVRSGTLYLPDGQHVDSYVQHFIKFF